jgi:hypothetical protein
MTRRGPYLKRYMMRTILDRYEALLKHIHMDVSDLTTLTEVTLKMVLMECKYEEEGPLPQAQHDSDHPRQI